MTKVSQHMTKTTNTGLKNSIRELWLCRILCRVVAEIALQLEGYFTPLGIFFCFAWNLSDWSAKLMAWGVCSLILLMVSSANDFKPVKTDKISFRVYMCIIICITSRPFVFIDIFWLLFRFCVCINKCAF